MKTSSFKYLFKEGMKSIWKNRVMSFASIGVLVACMLLIGIAILFTMNINSIVGYVEEQNEVVLILEDVDDSRISEIETTLNNMDNVFDVRFISKEEGLIDQSEWMGGDEELLEWLEEDNPLPDTFRLRVRDLSLLEATQNQLAALEGVEQVQAPQDVAQAVTGIKSVVYVGGIVIVGVLFVVSLLIIANTIKITVFNRRKEINIMKFVGATDGFIRMPFLIEGIMIGLISSLLSFGLLWALYSLLANKIMESTDSWISAIAPNILSFGDVWASILVIFLIIGVGIGTLGSMVFVRKHLKV